ncbi:hypothetical protein CLU79DRAFT_759458 [Phycomyces nitens]|nr:hypothetical protein CLU79DRAFT_780826 [Phycomyces nitens]KAI9019277.1 hypothetical protein CLU79DRAFT_759458 [Phycomyces nitens]
MESITRTPLPSQQFPFDLIQASRAILPKKKKKVFSHGYSSLINSHDLFQIRFCYCYYYYYTYFP